MIRKSSIEDSSSKWVDNKKNSSNNGLELVSFPNHSKDHKNHIIKIKKKNLIIKISIKKLKNQNKKPKKIQLKPKPKLKPKLRLKLKLKLNLNNKKFNKRKKVKLFPKLNSIKNTTIIKTDKKSITIKNKLVNKRNKKKNKKLKNLKLRKRRKNNKSQLKQSKNQKLKYKMTDGLLSAKSQPIKKDD